MMPEEVWTNHVINSFKNGPFGDLATFNPPGASPLCFKSKSDEELSEKFGRDPAWTRQLVFFCFVRDVNDEFAWDHSKVTNEGGREMAIYLSGGDVRIGLWRVASTFGEFVVDYLLKGRYGREAHFNYRVGRDVWGKGKRKTINFYQHAW